MDKRIFGTNQYIGTYYDLACYARSLGGDIFDEEKKNFTLMSDPAAYEAAKWCTELRTKHPLRPDAGRGRGPDLPGRPGGL